MSEQLSSPGREYISAETRRPSGRSFLSVVQNTMEYSMLPAAPEPQASNEKPFDFAEWRKSYYQDRWAKTREEGVTELDIVDGSL